MASDRIRELDPLTHQHRPSAVHDHDALLIRRLHFHEAHRRPGHSLANRFRIGRVVLLTLDIRLDVTRWHQSDIVAQPPQFSRPMMRRRTSLYSNQAGGELFKKWHHPRPRQPTPENNVPGPVNTVH